MTAAWGWAACTSLCDPQFETAHQTTTTPSYTHNGDQLCVTVDRVQLSQRETPWTVLHGNPNGNPNGSCARHDPLQQVAGL